MKILSPGKEGKWWVGVKVMCPKCKAVLELETDDIRGAERTPEAESTVIHAYFTCACCKNPLKVKPGEGIDQHVHTKEKK